MVVTGGGARWWSLGLRGCGGRGARTVPWSSVAWRRSHCPPPSVARDGKRGGGGQWGQVVEVEEVDMGGGGARTREEQRDGGRARRVVMVDVLLLLFARCI